MVTTAEGGMRLGLCLAAFGGTALPMALAETASYGPGKKPFKHRDL